MQYLQYKKLMCAVLAASMVVTGVPGTDVSASAAEQSDNSDKSQSENAKSDLPDPVSHYDFDGELPEDAKPVLKGLSEYEGSVEYGEGHTDDKADKSVKLGDYGIELPDKNIGEDYTVSLWVKSTDTIVENQSGVFLGYHDPEKWISLAGGSNGKYKVWTNDSNDSNYNWATLASVDQEKDKWRMVTFTQEGDEFSFYIDGEKVVTTTAPEALNGEDQGVYLGVTNWDSLFKGYMDDVTIYNEALDAAQIRELFDGKTSEDVLKEEGFTVAKSLSLKTGKSADLDVKIPASVLGYDISYTSEDESVATVADGKVTGVGTGETTITTRVALGDVVMSAKTAITVEESDVENLDVAAEYDFSSIEDGKIKDKSGNGNDAIVKGSGTTVTDNVLHLNGKGYVDLPTSIVDSLSDVEEFTIETTFTRDSDCGSNAWAYSIGAKKASSGANYIFLSPAFSGSTIRGGIKNSSTELLLDTGLTSVAGKEYTADMTIDNGKVTLYLNGVQVGKTIDSGYKVADIIKAGSDGDVLGYIGGSCWSADPNFKGTIKDFKIYNGVKSADEIQEAFGGQFQKDFESGVTVDELLGRNASADKVRYDLNLLTEFDENKITWESSDTSVLTNDGKVLNDKDEDKKVTFTGTVKNGNLSASQEFEFTVLKLDRKELDALIEKAEKLVNSSSCTESAIETLKSAIKTAEEADTQSKVRSATKALKNAIDNVQNDTLYIDPFSAIDESAFPAERSVEAGKTVVLTTIPSKIADVVTVEVSSDDEKVAEIANKDGEISVTARKTGSADITVAVTDKSGYTVLYETRINVVASESPSDDDVDNDENKESRILKFTFDDETDGLTSGDYSASGSYSSLSEGVDGKALYLSGSNSQYLTVADSNGKSPLTGLDEFTISYDFKAARSSTNWGYFATPLTAESGAQSYGAEKYTGSLINGGSTTIERYNNTGSRSSCPSLATKSGEWHHIDVVYEADKTILYVDKELRSVVDSTVDMTDLLGENSIFWLGHANWGSGENCKGYFDNFCIYNKALNDEELGVDIQESQRENLNRSVDISITDVKADYEDEMQVDEGENVDLTTPANVTFSDGSKTEAASIIWKDEDGNTVSNADALSAGVHELTGEISYFGNPVIDEKADPYVIYNEDDGYYYFTSSWPAYGSADNGYDRIALRRAKSLDGLKDAEDHVIWWHHTDGTAPKYHIWAPELHKVNGKWYVYFAGSASTTNKWDIHPYVIKCSNSDDLLSEDSWSDAVRFTNADGTYTDNFDNFDLDMTTFNLNGVDYVVWAHKPNVSYLKLGILDSDEPWHLKAGTDTMILTTPEYDWEMNGSSTSSMVNEGPAALFHDGKLYITYSASTTGPEYCMGMMSIDINADLFNIKNWTKSTKPILQTSDLYQQYGPGHNSFTVDKNGNVVIVYHSRDEECYENKCAWADNDPLYDPCRNANYAYVRFAEDGTPVFSSTEYKETKAYEESTGTKFTRIIKVGDDKSVVDHDEAALKINNIDDVRGNLTLPLAGERGSSISWNSSDPSVITDVEEDGKAAGVVTRQAKDTDVTLTATITYGEASVTKEFTAHVKAAVETPKLTKYLWAHFTGSESTAEEEQIYFSDSTDGYNWTALNDGDPVIESTLGEKGLRDPFIMRSPEGDKFYLIATDLSIYNNRGSNQWTRAATQGSKSIMVWESTDLVNWSDQRMVEVATDDSGCTWAPEACYNPETGEYYVYWASDVDGIKSVYYAKTRDFYTFSEPEVWITKNNKNGQQISVIDTSVLPVENEDGSYTYYRLTKAESSGGRSLQMEDSDPSSGTYEFLEVADSLDGPWTRIESDFLNSNTGVEGGTMMKLNNEDKYVLFLDKYSSGTGYFPSVTDDLSSGTFTKLSSSEYSFPGTMRHGTAMPITEDEYKAIEKKWGTAEEEIDTSVSLKDSAIANITFDKDDVLAADGLKITAANGYTVVDNDVLGGKALQLDSAGKQWLDVKTEDGKSVLSGQTAVTFNYWSKVTDASSANKGWTIFAANNGDLFKWPNETYFGIIDALPNASISDKGLTVQRFNDTGSRSAVNNTTNVDSEWKMVTAVATPKSTSLYVNGELISKVASKISLADLFGDEENGALQIGKANWNPGEYFNGEIDNISIYNRAITADEVKSIYTTKSYTGKIEKEYTLKKSWGKTYCLDEDGNRVTGFVTIDGARYYFDPANKGAMKTSAFFTAEENGREYTFRALRDGKLATGFVTTWSTSKYYFDEDYHMVTGFYDIDGKTYYFKENGVMAKGWITVDGEKYYFSSKGEMLVGEVTISGHKYTFSENGKLVNE